MVDPKNYREVAIDLEGFKQAVKPQFEHLNSMLKWVMGVLIAASGSAGLFMWTTAGQIKTDLAQTQEQVKGVEKALDDVKDRLKSLETRMTAVSDTNGQILKSVTKIETAVAPTSQFTPLVLTAEQQALVRDGLGLRGGRTNQNPEYKLGQEVPENLLRPTPDFLQAKIPELKGTKFALLKDDFVYIANDHNVVVAII